MRTILQDLWNAIWQCISVNGEIYLTHTLLAISGLSISHRVLLINVTKQNQRRDGLDQSLRLLVF